MNHLPVGDGNNSTAVALRGEAERRKATVERVGV